MKSIKRLLLIIFIVLLVCGASCSSSQVDSDNTGTKYLIGMSQANLVEPWRIIMNEDVNEEAKKYDDIRVIYTDAAQSTKKQIKDVENLLGYGIDLLMISPNDAEELKPVLDKAYKDIPVIVLDRDLGEEYTIYIGPDNALIGEMAGEFVADLLGEEGGVVVELKGLEGSPPTEERSEGFYKVLEKNKNIVVKDSIVCNWLRDNAEDKMKYYFLIDDTIDVVFAHNDAMAYGAYLAAEQLRVGGNIQYVGIDGLKGENGGKDLVEKGILKGTFYCPTGGKQAMNYAAQILHGEKVGTKTVKLKPEIIR